MPGTLSIELYMKRSLHALLQFLQIDSWCDCDTCIDRFDEEDNTEGRFWKDDGLDWDAIDMQFEKEGDDCTVVRLIGEEDLLQIDFWCDCDNGVDRYEEEDSADG